MLLFKDSVKKKRNASPNIVKVIKSKRVRRVGHVTRRGENVK
jgi:hypothetical protein